MIGMNKQVLRLAFFLLLLSFASVSCENDDEREIVVGQVSNPVAEFHRAQIVLVSAPGEEFSFPGCRLEGLEEEYHALVSLLERKGIEVCDLRAAAREAGQLQTEGMHSMVYVRDPMIATPCGIVIGKMKNEARQPEPSYVTRALCSMGLLPVYRVKGDQACLEGGDYFPFGNVCFIGCGLRTNQEAVDELMKADVLGADSIVVIRDRWHQQREMHLDTYLNIIDRDLMTLTCDRFDATPDDEAFLTADVYVRRAGFGNYDKVLADTPLLGFLQGLGVEVLRIGKYDTATLGGNFLCIAPRRIIASDDLSEAFVETLRRHRVELESSPAGNLCTGGGSIHCATQVISRK